MEITQLIKVGVSKAVEALYQHSINETDVLVSATRKEFEGDYTVVVFPFTKAARKAPPAVAEEMGNYLVEHVADIESFNIIKGFLNLVVSNAYWSKFLSEVAGQNEYGKHPDNGKRVVIEYSSPNESNHGHSRI